MLECGIVGLKGKSIFILDRYYQTALHRDHAHREYIPTTMFPCSLPDTLLPNFHYCCQCGRRKIASHWDFFK